MALTLERPVLEKIEALQNLMLASVTGGARGDGEYRQIREELFGLPGLKEALPRFVRTCGDLSQFWHFIKTQEGLSTYAGRRQFIWGAFRPLLAGVDDDAGVEREVFYADGPRRRDGQACAGRVRGVDAIRCRGVVPRPRYAAGAPAVPSDSTYLSLESTAFSKGRTQHRQESKPDR